MTWTDVRHRGAILRDVAATANARLDGVLPNDVPGVAEAFRDDLDLVGALQLRWHTRLAVNVEHAISGEPSDPAEAVAHAYRTTVAELPGLRAVVDGATDHPSSEEMGSALRRARAKELTLLAAAAGLPGPGAVVPLLAKQAATCLREPVTSPRSVTAEELIAADPPEDPVAHRAAARPSFAERLRAAVAA